jgi:hypothetical protein
MDEREERFIIKFLWLQEQGSKAIHAHLRALSEISLCLFLPCNGGCVASGKAIHPAKTKQSQKIPYNSRAILSKLLSEYPFASAKNIASHFNISGSTVKDLLARELGLRKFTWRRVSHSLSECQKKNG